VVGLLEAALDGLLDAALEGLFDGDRAFFANFGISMVSRTLSIFS
jgi:hypothetical protein